MKKAKETKVTEKENPIFLADGTRVVEGMIIFRRNIKTTSYKSDVEKYPEHYILKFSGKSRVTYEKHKVSKVNEASNSRSFTIRSKGGCESSYTVKETCIGNLFGKVESLRADLKKYAKDDADKIRRKVKAERESAEKNLIKVKKESLTKLSVARKIEANGSKIVYCDC